MNASGASIQQLLGAIRTLGPSKTFGCMGTSGGSANPPSTAVTTAFYQRGEPCRAVSKLCMAIQDLVTNVLTA